MRFLIFILLISAACCFAQESYRVIQNPKTEKVDILPAQQTLFILDYSNSMNETLGGATKYSLLLESLKIILSNINEQHKIGVRVYGHRWGFTPIDACRASSLIVPIGKNNVENITSSLAKLSPKGMTPITYSLKQAVKNDFKETNTDKHIILITDGGENCDESPCEYVMELVKYRKDIRIDVIALNIDNDDDMAQLRCVAKVTKGELYSANTHAELIKSMNSAFKSKKQVDAKIIGN